MRYIIYGEPVKHWTLIRFLQNYKNIKFGEWALVFTNHLLENRISPIFVYDEIPGQYDPNTHIGNYKAKIDKFVETFKVEPSMGYAFYLSSLESGYSQDLDESLAIWFADRLVKIVVESQPNIKGSDLEILLEAALAKEEYERAALIRDLLNKIDIDKYKIF